MATTDPAASTNANSSLESPRAQNIITEYLLSQSPAFLRLYEIRKEGWSNPQGDEFFRRQRLNADHPSNHAQAQFFKMTIGIGKELDRYTGAFRALKSRRDIVALDMGMAPGGFSAVILKQNPTAIVRAITLDHPDGGHEVQLNHQNLRLELRDINTLAGDLGLNSIPLNQIEEHHLVKESVLPETEKYDIVICGGQVVRNQAREEWREHQESRRLHLAQLIIALRKLKNDGTLILVLHKPESIFTAEIFRTFSLFSDFTLFKPCKAHSRRSSFYMVAKKVNTSSPEAIRMVARWQEEWRVATLETREEYETTFHKNATEASSMVEEYGEKLVELGNPIWAIQAQALEQWHAQLSPKQETEHGKEQ